MKPDGEGTRVTQESEYELKFGPLGKVMDSLIMKRKRNQGRSEIIIRPKRIVGTGVGQQG